MMKYFIVFCLVLELIGCVKKVDRDHLNFKDDVTIIENSIVTIDSLLHFLPPPVTDDRIQSVFYRVESADTILFLNANPVGNIHELSPGFLANILQIDSIKAIRFKEASLILLRNYIRSILRDYSGWYYVYKSTNDRGQHRRILYDYNDDKIELRVNHFNYEIIDKKGKLVLFKIHPFEMPIDRAYPDTISEVE